MIPGRFLLGFACSDRQAQGIGKNSSKRVLEQKARQPRPRPMLGRVSPVGDEMKSGRLGQEREILEVAPRDNGMPHDDVAGSQKRFIPIAIPGEARSSVGDRAHRDGAFSAP
jgi:hypothetical protein